MVNVLVLAHSNVHPRQQLFINELGKYVKTTAVMPVYWTRGLTLRKPHLIDKRNFNVYMVDTSEPGNWWPAIWGGLEKIFATEMPEWVISWEEPFAMVNWQLLNLKEKYGFKLLVFSWENSEYPIEDPWDKVYKKVLASCDLLQAGNMECAALWKKRVPEVAGKTFLLPQAGVDTELFKPLNMEKEYDVIFLGNHLWPQKGCAFVDVATRELNLKLIDVGEGPYEFRFSTKSVGYADYFDLPKYYNSAKIGCAHSMDTPRWKEQFANYFSVECLACGLPVVNSDTEAFKEYLSSLNGKCVFLTEMGDYALIKKNIKKALTKALSPKQEAVDVGRTYVEKELSNKVIAKRLIDCMKMKTQ
ncbi:MAG: glycosyltransferase [Bacillota bacterium]